MIKTARDMYFLSFDSILFFAFLTAGILTRAVNSSIDLLSLIQEGKIFVESGHRNDQ